jgi:phytoene/squalene synthetase
LGIRSLHKRFHAPINAIYGYVRVADEIVDTFLDFNRAELLDRFRKETYLALDEGVSTNPVIHAFQEVVRKYGIEIELIDAFLDSMAMDLDQDRYDRQGFEGYIYGSAEVVGLMCLRVFCEGDRDQFEELRSPAKSLGAAFQKVNFLRDLKEDYGDLGRIYFPGVDFSSFSERDKEEIEAEIEKDFADALEGIMNLPRGAKFGVYLAYVYYKKLFDRIRKTPASEIMARRIRVSNPRKVLLLARSYLSHAAGVL